jgi:hypothetical protein
LGFQDVREIPNAFIRSKIGVLSENNVESIGEKQYQICFLKAGQHLISLGVLISSSVLSSNNL